MFHLLVVYLRLWNIWSSQLGWLLPIYGKNENIHVPVKHISQLGWWNDEIPNIWKIQKSCSSHHQPVHGPNISPGCFRPWRTPRHALRGPRLRSGRWRPPGPGSEPCANHWEMQRCSTGSAWKKWRNFTISPSKCWNFAMKMVWFHHFFAERYHFTGIMFYHLWGYDGWYFGINAGLSPCLLG